MNEAQISVKPGTGPSVGARNPKIVYMKKAETGVAKDLFADIKRVYHGKPQRQIDELLAKHSITAATGRKRVVSMATRKSYADNLSRFITSLKEENMAVQNLDEITTKQVRRVFLCYERRSLSASRLASIAGSVRRLGIWLGKPDLCPDLDEMLLNPDNGKRSYSAKTPKTWEANGVDVEAGIALIAAVCPITALQFELAHEFGARVEEFLMFKPAKAIRNEHEIWISDGTKGGRPRAVPIEHDSQREALRRMKELAELNPKGIVQAQRGDSLRQAKAHMRYILTKVGITKKGLGVTPHGLRHGYACRTFKQLTGEDAPVLGGGLVDPEREGAARDEIAQRMGHNRRAIVSAYTGNHRTLSRSQTQNLKQLRDILERDTVLSTLAREGGVAEIYLLGPSAEGKPVHKGGIILLGYAAHKQEHERQAEADARVAVGALCVSQRVSQMLGVLCTHAPLVGTDPQIPRFEIFLGRGQKADQDNRGDDIEPSRGA